MQDQLAAEKLESEADRHYINQLVGQINDYQNELKKRGIFPKQRQNNMIDYESKETSNHNTNVNTPQSSNTTPQIEFDVEPNSIEYYKNEV